MRREKTDPTHYVSALVWDFATDKIILWTYCPSGLVDTTYPFIGVMADFMALAETHNTSYSSLFFNYRI